MAYSFGKNSIQVLLKMSIDNAAMLRVVSELLAMQAANGNEEKLRQIKEQMDLLHATSIKAISDHLYEQHGDLPEGLLPDED